MKKLINFFDKLEDGVRGHLSHHPIIYTLIGGTGVVLFWRGVWHTADMLQAQGGWLGWIFYEPVNLLIVIAILLVTGLFVSYFIGDTILISGLKGQKKIADKTEREVKEEEVKIAEIQQAVKDIQKEVTHIREAVAEEVAHHHPESGSHKN